MSRLDLIVGPNGAGKTTFFERVIAPGRPGLPFVNPDRIALDRFGSDAEAHAYEAARIATSTRGALIEARIDFCTETVFSHPSKLDLVETAIAAGYDIALHVVMIPLKLSGPRVAARMASGGHSVPPEKLADRYRRLWPNVAVAVHVCRRAVFWDNSGDSGPIEVASFRFGIADHPPRWPDWTPTEIAALR